MSTQWHPLFVYLLRLLLDAYYRLEPEVPVSDLPRRGDLFVLRRTGSAEPPFTGLWSHLTSWNIFELKGPTDAPEESDLELLVHVGTGITYRFNEERRGQGEEVLPNRAVSFWYLAPRLGETFMEAARLRTFFDYEGGGLWRGRVWGHPVFLVGYRDLPVEPDTVPLHLLTPEPESIPPAIGEVIAKSWELLQPFAEWLSAVSPNLLKGAEHMAGDRLGITPEGAANLFKSYSLKELIGISKQAGIIEGTSASELVEAFGASELIETFGASELVEAFGASEVVKMLGASEVVKELIQETTVEELIKELTAEQKEELRRRLQEG